MRFSKSVLSQNLRTRCDLALYLTLFTGSQLDKARLPTPLEARPGVGTLQAAGVEQEKQIYRRLEQAFKGCCLGAAPTSPDKEWTDMPLDKLLSQIARTPAILIQPKFSIEDHRTSVLGRLGVEAASIPLIPKIEGMIPDVVLVEAAVETMSELTPAGDRLPIASDNARVSLTVVDVKHARDANPSYEAEVVLYAVMIANWLNDHGYADRFFVNADPRLWTRGGFGQNVLQQALDDGETDLDKLIVCTRKELDPINVPIYVQCIRRFFGEQLPTVIRLGQQDWTKLDWHVGSSCASCDWLGFEGWLGPSDRNKAAAHPEHYCFTRAGICDHLSRLPLLTRGSRRVLENDGLTTVAQVTTTSGAEATYSKHTKLKSDRRSIPGYATAITTSRPSIDPSRPDGMLARYADLDIFLSVNFDPGAGLLTGISLHAYFRQPVPCGHPAADRDKKNWRERWIVSGKTPAAEEAVVLSFVSKLASIFDHVLDNDPNKGGPHSGQARSQIIFWDRRQFEELSLALGRHLPSLRQANRASHEGARLGVPA